MSEEMILISQVVAVLVIAGMGLGCQLFWHVKEK